MTRTAKFAIKIGLAIIFGLVLIFNSVYKVETNEEALIFTFGAHTSTEGNGFPKFKIPFVQSVVKTDIQELRSITSGYQQKGNQYTPVPEESLMLTADEALLDVETAMQYMVVDSAAYRLKVENPDEVLRHVFNRSIRRVVANHKLDETLTDNKDVIQLEILQETQELANQYGLGVMVKEVQFQDVDPPAEVEAAFKDVSTAKEDKNSKINTANGIAADVIPKARGEAEEIMNRAEGYKQSRINHANGDVAKFREIISQYQNGKAVTRSRMYWEMVETVFPNAEIIIMDGNSSQVYHMGQIGQPKN
jgi:membrane protease subunit HflK